MKNLLKVTLYIRDDEIGWETQDEVQTVIEDIETAVRGVLLDDERIDHIRFKLKSTYDD